MDKKEIEDWIKAFNQEQFKRMKDDDYKDYIDDEDINGRHRFRGGGEWSVELTVPQAILDLLPEWERECWWEVDVLMDEDDDECEGIFENEEEACEEYGVKSIDEINAHFVRRFYQLSLDEEEWWVALEKEIEGKTGLPFEQIRVCY